MKKTRKIQILGGFPKSDWLQDDETHSEYIKNKPDIDSMSDKITTLESQIADILYKPVSITSFDHNKGTVERGVTITDVTLSWTTNKTPTTLTLDGEFLDVALTSKALSNLTITWDSNQTWTLVATDERGESNSKTTSITFYNGVYYGAAIAPDSYDSNFIVGLNKKLRGNKLSSFEANADEGEYIYYCLPTRYGACSFKVGGFEGGFTLLSTLAFTNASGYTEDYYIYRSDNSSLGHTTVEVS